MIQKRDDLPAEDAESGEEAVAAAPETAAEESAPEEDGPVNRLADVPEDGDAEAEPSPEEAQAAEDEPVSRLADDDEPAEEAVEAPDEGDAEADEAETPDEQAQTDEDAEQASLDEAGEQASADDAPSDDEVTEDLGAPAGEGDEPAEEPSEPGRPLTQRVEAILFAAATPLAPAKLARVLDEPLDDIKAALEELVEVWAQRPGAIDLVAIAGGWRFMTRPEFQADLAGMAKKGKVERLSPAALETLAIVAYKQPLTRAEVETIRGVAAGPLLRVLLDRDLIRVSGRSPEPGHPLLYGTTKRFLDHFGLDSLRGLPDIKDLLDVS